jgi:hypothetical protein
MMARGEDGAESGQKQYDEIGQRVTARLAIDCYGSGLNERVYRR